MFDPSGVSQRGGVVEPAKAKETDKKVCAIIAESLCVEADQVTPDSNLMRDLGAESIDFLDIMFRLEKEFEIKIPQREIERMARGGMTPEEFEKDGVLQAKGIERLRQLLPEINPADWREGMALRELPSLFTVGVFCSIVKRKLDGTLLDGLPPESQSGT
jgi:acyl carrier protein